jgi:uncharacterized protein (DUF1810 family)
MADFDLERFVAAQQPVYRQVERELGRGEKESHWMWFVFPQIAGLGFSPTARHFAISGPEEARAFLDHELLGARLRECTQAVLAHRGRSAEAIFGPVDAIKFRSSMTLFDAVAEEGSPFAEAIRLFFGGERDRATLERLVPASRQG